MAQIRIKDIRKTLGMGKEKSLAVNGVTLDVPDGKTVVIIGPTGCGKTSLLKVIAGLEFPDGGSIHFDDEDVTRLKPAKRRIGMVFQDLALYPHLTGKRNILSWFWFRKRSGGQETVAMDKLEQISEMLDVTVETLLERKPKELSGGEKQRVALGRCVARNPMVFLLDEPFHQLDTKFRQQYRVNLKKILQSFKITTVLVTHDQREANLMGDLVAVMNEGKIEQVGTYRELYDNPVNSFVGGFLNLDQDLPALNLVDAEAAGGKAGKVFGIRPEAVAVCLHPQAGYLEGEVKFITPNPAKNEQIIEIALGQDRVFAVCKADEKITTGRIWMKFGDHFVFNKSDGKRVS